MAAMRVRNECRRDRTAIQLVEISHGKKSHAVRNVICANLGMLSHFLSKVGHVSVQAL
jgi:hypothetical protein